MVGRAKVAICIILAAIGCTGEDSYEAQTVPVSGVVTYQGKPLPAGYQVIFMPQGGIRAAMGKTDDQGKFTLGTNEKGDGAPISTHNVAVTFVPEIPGESGKETLNAPLPKPPVKLPYKFTDPARSGITVEVPPEGLTDYKLELE